MMDAATMLDKLLGQSEVPASDEETQLLAELRTACVARDKAQKHVDGLLERIRDLQRARRRQMNES